MFPLIAASGVINRLYERRHTKKVRVSQGLTTYFTINQSTVLDNVESTILMGEDRDVLDFSEN